MGDADHAGQYGFRNASIGAGRWWPQVCHANPPKDRPTGATTQRVNFMRWLAHGSAMTWRPPRMATIPLRAAGTRTLFGGRHRGIPPRTDPGHAPIVSLHHVDRLALTKLRHAKAHLARLRLLFRRQPGPLVTP